MATDRQHVNLRMTVAPGDRKPQQQEEHRKSKSQEEPGRAKKNQGIVQPSEQSSEQPGEQPSEQPREQIN